MWEVLDPVVVQNLDRLEGHPDWYKRDLISVELVEGATVRAFIYFNATVSDKSGKGVVVEDAVFV